MIRGLFVRDFASFSFKQFLEEFKVSFLSQARWKRSLFQVAKYYDYTKDREFLKQNIAILEKEFEYWQNEKMVNVMKDGKTYRMARYVTNSNGPRPESYK